MNDVDTTNTRRKPRFRSKRFRTGFGLGAALLAVGGAIGWASAVVFTPPVDPEPADRFSLVTVVEGEVGSSLSLTAEAEWPTSPVALNAADGTVTSVDIEAGQSVNFGDKIFSVNMRPVTAGQGEVPAFGSIAPGDQGAIVGQLQAMLEKLGLWQGGVTNEYSQSMVAAVQQWQRQAGYPPDGIVQAGDIVWFPELPARVTLETAVISKGLPILAGSGAITVLNSTPTFTISMQEEQTRLATTGVAVLVEPPEGPPWDAVVETQRPAPDSPGVFEVLIAAPDGGPVCRDKCGAIKPNGQTLMPAEIQTTPTRSGLTVPVAALVTEASGKTAVISAEGKTIEVTVVQSARGIALIEGVEPGAQVRVPGETEPT